MENRKKYNILWLNNELRVDFCNPMFQLLDTLRNEVESKYENLFIQTCVWGKDFLEFAQDQSQKWNAFVIDPYGKMSEGSRITIGKHLINDYGFKDLVQKFEVLMYCFTKDTNEGLDENDNLSPLSVASTLSSGVINLTLQILDFAILPNGSLTINCAS